MGLNIYDVARAAGVSTATVSRVMNGKPDVSPEVRRRVLQVIESLDFKPKVGRVELDTIAVFAPMDHFRLRYSTYFSDLLLGISYTVCDYDLNLELVSLRKMPKDPMQFTVFCRERRIRGGVFVLTLSTDYYVPELVKTGSFVVVGDHFGEGIPSVKSDNFGGGYKAAKHLVDIGHRRIGVIVTDIRFADHKQRVEGYRKALADAGLSIDSSHYIDVGDSFSSGGDVEFRVRTMLSSANRPTALLMTNTTVAADVARIMDSAGLHIPDDMSVVGFDDDVWAVRLQPPLTTVRQPVFELGQAAAREAIALSNGEKEPSEVAVVLATDLIIRGSTGALPVEG
jgi:LacI family transcriptional regulator